MNISAICNFLKLKKYLSIYYFVLIVMLQHSYKTILANKPKEHYMSFYLL